MINDDGTLRNKLSLGCIDMKMMHSDDGMFLSLFGCTAMKWLLCDDVLLQGLFYLACLEKESGFVMMDH